MYRQEKHRKFKQETVNKLVRREKSIYKKYNQETESDIKKKKEKEKKKGTPADTRIDFNINP